jgi:hypothetical protein
LASAWAKERGIAGKDYPADWNDLDHPQAIIKTRKNGTKYNVNAGFIRNQQMLDENEIDLVIAFPGGNGTADMIKRSLAKNIKVIKVDKK